MASVVVTGFGVFAGVEDNPSKRIVEELQASQFQCADNRKITYKILDVSVEFCCKLHDDLIATAGTKQIFIHIGVDSRATFIKLEQCAYNNMTFRVPDVCGYQPENCVICEASDLDCPLYSDLPLEQLCAELNQAHPAVVSGAEEPVTERVQLSQDPGRYLCNYTYYQALLHQQRLGQPLHSVFVHVPPFEVIPQQEQVAMIQALVQSIVTRCSTES
jgi:pyroglutamyl-peptidase